MNKKKLIWQLPFLVLLIIGTIVILKKQPPFRTNEGLVFGTVYKITYQSQEDLHQEIKQALQDVDNSLSPYNKNSIITRINHNEDTMLNKAFTNVFNLSQKISQETDGAFDITVAPLVNAWGFGFKHALTMDSLKIDSILQFVGYNKIKIDNNKIIKQDERIMLDCSSIAKGYGVDAVSQLLKGKGIQNFMVDIGGEVVVKGKNPRMKQWRIGINKPIDDSLSVNQELQTILEVTDLGMATSGNYRKYYENNGVKYSHTINPFTGFPVAHTLLSVSVLAPKAWEADAMATAFMVMGLEKSLEFLEKNPICEAYFIYNQDGEYKTCSTEGFKTVIIK